MGFHISIGSSSQRLLQTLKAAPEEIFPQQYHCYLLFLVGASDDDAMDWLIKNVTSLDSLTGQELAFGIFMKQLKIPVSVSSQGNNPTGPKLAATIPLEDFKDFESQIDRIIKDHIHQRIYSGDEVMAITYATDIVAREFNVTDRLPCIVLLDPIPLGKVHVVQLSPAICSNLFKILRQSIHKYLADIEGKPNAFSHASFILEAQNNISNWNKKGEQLRTKIEGLNNELNRLNGEDLNIKNKYLELTRCIDLVKQHITVGATRKIKNLLFGYTLETKFKLELQAYISSQEAILDFLEQEGPVLNRLNRTIDSLEYYISNYQESEEFTKRVQVIYEEHVFKIIGEGSSILQAIDKPIIKKWIEKLTLKKNDLVNEFSSLLPGHLDIAKKIRQDFQDSNREVILTLQQMLQKSESELENYESSYYTRKENLEGQLDAALKLYQHNKPITFSSVFIKEVKSLKLDGYLSQTKVTGGRFVENLLKPDTIMKIFEFFQKTAG